FMAPLVNINGNSVNGRKILVVTIKQIKLTSLKHSAIGKNYNKLTSAEQGKLWATYIGNTMSVCVLSYMLNHVQDQEIKKVLENGLGLSRQFVQFITELYTKENYPIPQGFTDEDVH